MLEIFIKLIPKASNEFVFVLGLLGLFILCQNKRKSEYVHVILIIIFGMITWRVVYRITSSRYASALIYPFSILTSYFLVFLIRHKSKRKTLIIIIVGICLIASWTCKNYNVTQINSSVITLAQLHDQKNIKDKWTLFVPEEDLLRIKQFEKNDNSFSIYQEDKTINDVKAFISDYKTVGKKALFCIILDSETNSNVNQRMDEGKYQHILSVFYQKNRKKRLHVYSVESNASVLTLSNNKTIQPESGILSNGDLELLDSPQKSHDKLKSHIGRYALFYDFDETIRTPVNAYFHNDSSFTQFLPYYNCFGSDSISGLNSARISISKGVGYILFYQRFHSGKYQYSVTLKGKKGTTVCLVYDVFNDKHWDVRPLALFTIPNKGIFKITTSFDVQFPASEDFFLVGAWVNNGEVYLDNFCITNND